MNKVRRDAKKNQKIYFTVTIDNYDFWGWPQ